MNRLERPTFPGFGDRRGWFTVHTLSEFVFCPRAGVIAYDNQQMDEVDNPPPRLNLDYLPDYSIARIEEALQQQFRDLRRQSFRLVAVLVFAVILFNYAPLAAVAAAAGLVIVVGWQMADRLDKVLLLVARRRQAMEASAREPVPSSARMQRVNWWELLRAGYESEVDEIVLEDESLQIAGRPWRILKKGSLRIPVVKALSPKGRELPEVKAQHSTRIAAYCRLIKENVGAEAPYGIVIFGDTYEGWTVPNNDTLQEELVAVVQIARDHLKAADSLDSAIEPDSTSICTGCPHGEPFLLDRSRMGEKGSRGTTSQRNGKLYHSKCGDLFRWVPPHRSAAKLRLRGL